MAETINIILLGYTNSGKTCIIDRFVKGIYNDNTNASTGGDYFLKTIDINGKEVKIGIRDTSGMEKYRQITKLFCKEANIAILSYSIAEKRSFETLKNIWYPDFKESGEKCKVIAIVGSKSDLYDKQEVEDNEVKMFAKEINAQFFLVSAKTGDNIDLLFKSVIRQYLGLPPLQEEKGEGKDNEKKIPKENKKQKDCMIY